MKQLLKPGIPVSATVPNEVKVCRLRTNGHSAFVFWQSKHNVEDPVFEQLIADGMGVRAVPCMHTWGIYELGNGEIGEDFRRRNGKTEYGVAA